MTALPLRLLLAGFLMLAAVIQANASASDTVRAKLEEALYGQLKIIVDRAAAHDGIPPAEAKRQLDDAFEKGRVRYAHFFSVSDGSARELLAKGPDDLANLLAMKVNAEFYHRVHVPLPTLLEFMHIQVATRVITGGWDLELARRISDAHIAEALEAEKRHEAQPAKP
jgi:hypothetical protein